MEHQSETLELKQEVTKLQIFNENIQRTLVKNMCCVVGYQGMLRIGLTITYMNIVGPKVKKAVQVCRDIGLLKKYNFKKVIQAGLNLVEISREVISQSDHRELINTIVELKSTIKKIKEVSVVNDDILQRMDKPASLQDLGLKRVNGLDFLEPGEQLPVTLKNQLQQWPTTNDSRIRENAEFLVIALERIKDTCERM
jgi:hypothetical protein